MDNTIWVLADVFRNVLSDGTFETLALGREIARTLDAALEAVVLGHGIERLAEGLGAADAVLYADHPALAAPVPQHHARALAQLAAERNPGAIFVPLSNATMDLGSLAAARLSAPFVNFCCDVQVAGAQIEARCVLYGAKIEAVVVPRAAPAILGILPGVRPPDAGRSERVPQIVSVAVAPDGPPVQFDRYLEPPAGDVDIAQQDVLVAVGRGIGGHDNLALAEDLAEVLGGAVCASRPIIDQGWVSASRQVGTSGVIVKPRLYIAAGISGAPEHVEGMKRAGLIVAINTDPHAPIFNVAHYGAVADALEILPALTAAARTKKG